MREKLVEAKGLYKRYALKSDKLFAKRRYLKAVDGVTFDIYKVNVPCIHERIRQPYCYRL